MVLRGNDLHRPWGKDTVQGAGEQKTTWYWQTKDIYSRNLSVSNKEGQTKKDGRLFVLSDQLTNETSTLHKT